MVLALQNARARFLENAARAYTQTDSATSSHLITQLNSVNVQGGKISSEDFSCRACGTIQLPGLTSSTTIAGEVSEEKRSSREMAKRKVTQVNGKSVQITCLKCHHYVKHALPRSVQCSRKTVPSQDKTALPPTSNEDAAKSTPTSTSHKSATSNAGSRQRAKARKGGLQAMLEKSKQNLMPSSETGLDLMDFMKQE